MSDWEKERELITSLLFRRHVFSHCTSCVTTPSLLIIYVNHSYLSTSLIHSYLPLSLSIILIYLHSSSKLINHLLCDPSIILMIIHHQIFTLPSLYPLSMCSKPLIFPFSHLYYTLTTVLSFLLTDPSLKMDNAFENLKKTCSNMPRNVLKLIYWYHLERSRFFIKFGLLRDMQEIIEAKMHLVGELPSSFVKHLLGMGKSSYSKKRKAKRMWVCHKYVR